MKTISLILAGGKGTRLWPLSRENKPKQFLNIHSDQTLIEDAFDRVKPIVGDEQWVITSKEMVDYFKLYVKAYDTWKHSEETKLIIEPQSKNTTASILYSAELARRNYGDDCIMIVLPSDQVIENDECFREEIKLGIEKAKEGAFVIYGVNPSYAEGGYGYIGADNGRVIDYIEKPVVEQAEELIAKGNYYWNSGIYVFQVGTFINAAEKHMSEIYNLLDEEDITDQSFLNQLYQDVPNVSINNSLIDKLEGMKMVPFTCDWNTVNSWKNYYETSNKDLEGNVLGDNALSFDSKSSLVYSEDKFVSLVGVEDIGVVSVDDSIVVCNLKESEKVKNLFQNLKEKSRREVNYNNIGVRPWGSYHVLEEGFGYKIKRIKVDPKQKLSLQMHYHRSEHWIVVKGIARVVNGEEEFYVRENESTYIPATTVHRLENPGVLPLEIIEVQCGSYLEEDDIVRFEDIYDRN